MLKSELEELIKDAMRNRDKVRLSILRQVKEELKKIEVDERREVVEQDVDAALKKLLKMTNETLEGSIKAANDDERTKNLQEQVAVLESIMPQQVEGAELEALIDEIIAQGGFESKRDMGKVMGQINAKTGGNFDKPAAAQMVGARLS